jgi:hypothetical protein
MLTCKLTKSIPTENGALTLPFCVSIEKDQEGLDGALGLFKRTGYRVYQHPVDPDYFAVISPFRLTYNDWRWGYIDKDDIEWWDSESEYNQYPSCSEELVAYFEEETP